MNNTREQVLCGNLRRSARKKRGGAGVRLELWSRKALFFSRIGILLAVGASTLAAAAPTPVQASGKDATAGGEARAAVVTARLISSPDLFNADIGNISHVRGYKPGFNTWNGSKAANMANLFGQFRAENADGYLVAGDLVQGRWTEDQGDTGIFGPSRTVMQAKRRIEVAGNAYYTAWKGFWVAAGIPLSKVHPALGDHEIGDNPWRNDTVKGRKKFANVATFKDVWAKHFTRSEGGDLRYDEHPRGTDFDNTAYATYVTPGLLLVTVDVFKQTRHAVHTTVDAEQLDWLDGVLSEGRRRGATIVVQGHTPIAGPVRQCDCSSGLTLRGGAKSRLWKTMVKHDVDFYFAGEVHASSARQETVGGLIQISHGTIAGYGPVGFLRMDLMSDGSVTISNRVVPVAVRGSGAHMWQTRGHLPADYALASASVETGTMVVAADGTVARESGDLVRLQ